MPKVITMVCLAKSRRPGGNCIAGRDFGSEMVGPWIRPLGSGENGAITGDDCRFQNGSEPSILDIVSVPVVEKAVPLWPHQHQVENWIAATKFFWSHIDVLEPWALSMFVAPVGPLWIDGHSTSSGLNDKIPSRLAALIDGSLRLIRVNHIVIRVFRDATARGIKLRVQGQFEYSGTSYWLWVTDREWEKYFLDRGEGSWEFGECYVTVSLSEFYRGACYKLIAGIFWDDE